MRSQRLKRVRQRFEVATVEVPSDLDQQLVL
jgi:hypothetical protein